MLEALEITEEEAEGLAELARHDLAMARDFARRTQAAEDDEVAAQLARSYHRAAYSYRQTLALKVRLRREMAQADTASTRARAEAAKPPPNGVAFLASRRTGELRTALLRLAWNEAERPEAEAGTEFGAEPSAPDPVRIAQHFRRRREALDGAITEDCLRPEFGAELLDAQVARLALAQGFAPAVVSRWRELPDPPPLPGETARRSSA